MKKLFLLAGGCMLALFANAQNTNPWPSTGSVGIGTTIPYKILEVRTGQNNVASIGDILSTGNYAGLHFGYLEDNTAYRKSALVFERLDNSARGKIHLLNNGGENSSSAALNDARLTIDHTGKTGIGTTNPGALLEVNGDSKINNGLYLGKNITSQTDNVVLNITQQRTTLRFNYASLGETGSGASTILGNNIAVAGYTNNAVVRTSSSVDPASFIRLNYLNGITFHTGIQSTLGQAVSDDTDEKMRISQVGNILIGKTSQTNTDYKLDVGGKIRANEIVVNTDGADFVFAKDYKLRSLANVKAYISSNGHLPDIPPAKTMQEEGVGVGELQTKLLQKIEELTLYIIEQDKRIRELESNKKKKK